MRRRRKKHDIYVVIFLALLTIGYFIYNHASAESRGIAHYSNALKTYKASDYELAYQEFGKVPSASSLKSSKVAFFTGKSSQRFPTLSSINLSSSLPVTS